MLAMNLDHLNLSDVPADISQDAKILLFLISEDLKGRRLINGLTDIGCEGSFCTTNLCELVLAYAGFDDRENELYDFYFELVDRYCVNVSHRNHTPIKEALIIYEKLLQRRSQVQQRSTIF
jgi:hypothetical protein